MGWGLKHEAFDGTTFDLEGPRYYIVRSDYDAMSGIQDSPGSITPQNALSVDHVHWGIWGWPVFGTRHFSGPKLLRYQQGSFRDVADGLSHTIAVVERAEKPKDYLKGKLNIHPGNPNAWYSGQIGCSASNTFVHSINADGVGENQSNSRDIYSIQPGGANVGIADGSVRFLDSRSGLNTEIA